MSFRTRIAALLAAAALFAGAELIACGDKFLVVGRGTRFQRAGRAHPFLVLIYAPPSSPLGDGLRKVPVEKALSHAGYRQAKAGSSSDLAEILKSGSPDVVIADIGDARVLEGQMASGSSGSVVLPVLANASREELTEARRTFGVALKSPPSQDSLLDAVDEAVDRLESRRKAGLKR